MTTVQKGNIRLYCAGGAGINIGKLLEEFRGASEPGMGVLDQAYIDTSLSNARGMNESNAYIFDNMDGSGKVRRENAQEIADRTREILQKYPAMDLNIVLSSASGGSGSVIGPSLVSELLERDHPVVVIAIGGTDTRLEIDNTIKTIKSYDSIGRMRKAPVVMAYFQNSKETPRAVVDKKVLEMISALMTVFSRENAELDSQDLYNFLHFDKVTTFQVQLASLISLSGDFPSDLDGRAISVAALMNEGEHTQLPFTPDYQCVGFLPPLAHDRVRQIAPIYLVTVSDTVGAVSKELAARLAELDQAQRARVNTTKLLSDGDKPESNGLIL